MKVTSVYQETGNDKSNTLFIKIFYILYIYIETTKAMVISDIT